MKIKQQLEAEIAGKPCRLCIAGYSEDDPSEIYHGTVGEITEQSGILRIQIAEARKISTSDWQPLLERPEFICTDPENRLTIKMSSDGSSTVFTLFNPPLVLTVFEQQESLDTPETPIPA